MARNARSMFQRSSDPFREKNREEADGPPVAIDDQALGREIIGKGGTIEIAYVSQSVGFTSGEALAMTVHMIYGEGDKRTEATILIKPPRSFFLTDRIVRLELRDLVDAIQAMVQSPQSLIWRGGMQEQRQPL